MRISSMRLGTAAAISAMALLGMCEAAHADTVYSISPRDDQLRVVDPADASTLSSATITLAGKTVVGGTGLAAHPGSGALWAVLRIAGQNGRELVTIDPLTGVATSVGDTGGAFAGLAFNASGVLYGVTGEQSLGGLAPETLFTLSTTTAAPTAVCALGNGTDGEAIAFDTSGLLYHASGHPDDVIFETVDTGAACATTSIPIAGTPLVDEEAMALAFWPAHNAFLWSQDHNEPPGPILYRVTPNGAPTAIGALDHVSKGLAVVGPVHFACYLARAADRFTPREATLEDQFRSATVTVAKVESLCNPADKNGENPAAPSHPDHLVAYAITQSVPPKFAPMFRIRVEDQFGARQVDALTPDRLLVPSGKSLTPTACCPSGMVCIPELPPCLRSNPAVDHFVCYTVQTSAGTPKFTRVNGVNVVDQFGVRQVDLTKPSRLCNPVDKNGGEPGAEAHVQHLMCYEALPSPGSARFSPVTPIFVDNQFGRQELAAIAPSDLCVPALKTPPAP